MSTNFSYYKGPIRNVKPEKSMTLDQAIALIKSDKLKEDIERLRNSNDPATRKTLKNCLPYFTFSGVFDKRINDGLKSHSNLIVLDFDDLNDDQLIQLKNDFASIDFVRAIFISPSGNGLKVVVEFAIVEMVDNTKQITLSLSNAAKYHLQVFKELAVFFDDNFSLKVDESGKDLARACFASYDPDTYFNPKSNSYVLKSVEDSGVASAQRSKTVPVNENLSDFEHQRKVSKYLARVEYVVKQIEEAQLDITSDYKDWQLIAFSLASLGEEAREYFHRVSMQNPEYIQSDSNDKFDDALVKGKFKTPEKFFSLAKEHDLYVKLPSTIQEVQKAADAKQVIGDEDSSNDYLKYGIYLNKTSGTYWSLDTKNIPREISNFQLRILYHINTGKDEAYRLMQIKNIHGLDRILRINTDDFVSAGSFKKVIARLGNFIWKGQDHDLVRLQDMLQRHECHTEMVDTLGWNKKGKFYAFANGIFDTVENKFLATDPYGIIVNKDINYFIPALSKVFADKDDLFANEKKFIYIESKVQYMAWANQFVKVYGDNGRIGLVFWVCALFSDILFKAMGLRMPMPFSYGKRGSGKGTMTQSLTRLWGDKQDQIMLGGATTVVGFMRKMAQFSNGLVWLDEYKNNLQLKTIESIKNLYDRIGYERGKKDNGFSTESTPILSAVWLSGQEMPTAEPALFTRCILLNFAETKRTEAQREEFRKLGRMEDAGLSHLTVQLLNSRQMIERDYQEVYEQELRLLADDVNNNDVDERLLGNYSMLLASAKLMDSLGMLPFSYDDFKGQCISNLMNQFFVLKGSDDTSKFWQVVEQLVNAYVIKDGEHYTLANGYIYIYIQDVYHHYVKAMNDRREVNILDKSTLENYLKSDAKAFVSKKKKQIGTKYSWAMVFKYKEIDIDIIRGIDAKEIREKSVEMGVEYEEDGLTHVNDGMPQPVQIKADF